MTRYDTTFNKRGEAYNQAMAACPDAREAERRHLVTLLQPQPGECVIDAPAGGGYLAEALAERGCEVVCVEPAARFARPLAGRFRALTCPLTHLAVEDASTDRLGSLAGLHHLEAAEVDRFFAEAFRVLKPGGTIAVADVKTGTGPARFLNGPVDAFSETGHDGRFFRDGEFTDRLAAAGFVGTDEVFEAFTWSFADADTLVRFCRSLFGMFVASERQVAEALDAALQPFTDGQGRAHLPWSLLYAVGRKPR